MTDHSSLVERIAKYATDLQYDSISPEAVRLAKWLIFDSIGTGLGGYQRDLGKKAVRFGLQQMPGNQATLLGDGSTVSTEGAAFANAVMVKILGMDDSHRSASHIASQVIPAVLAASETYQTPGKDIIAAIVAAYDIAIRIGAQVRGPQRERGLDVKGTVGVIAATAAVARCAGIGSNTMSHAIALASDMSSGTEQYVYESGNCDTKDLISGFAARNAIFATRLAQADFHGPRGALDGEYGFFRAFGDGFDVTRFDDLGDYFAITSTGFKPHGGCRHTHQAIDAVQQLLEDGPLAPSEIEKVTLSTYEYATRPSFRVDPNPPSRDVAGLSIRVSTAIALTRQSAWPDDFDHWDDPEVRRLRQIIDVTVDPEIQKSYPDSNGCRLRVSLDTGETREAYLPFMKGEPEFRMNEGELIEKFRVLARDLFPVSRIEEIYALCDQLESITDIRQVMKLTARQATTDGMHVT